MSSSIPRTWYWSAFLLVLFAVAYSTLLLDEPVALAIATEDGPIEYIGAASFLCAGLVFLHLFLTSARGDSSRLFRRNGFYLLLAIAFLFAAGEEISWGQRLIGFETPPAVLELNTQGEFNIHNLGDNKEAFQKLYRFFCITYGFLAPLIASRVRFAKKLAARIGLPLIPLWIGIFFPMIHVTERLIKHYLYLNGNLPHLFWPTSEIGESFSALLFMLAALCLAATPSKTVQVP